MKRAVFAMSLALATIAGGEVRGAPPPDAAPPPEVRPKSGAADRQGGAAPESSASAPASKSAQPSGSETAPPLTPRPDATTSTQSPDPTNAAPAALEASEPLAIDRILPSGLRIIIAQDSSLPVAAVVLAIETGIEDDPPDKPGLVHALAYQLLQGNREIAPGGIEQLVHDAGGVATLAVGPAQVRFESLVPAAILDELLWAESQRLRSPTVSRVLWDDALRWADRDPARKWALDAQARAAIHQVPGLAHDGRAVSEPLRELDSRTVSVQLNKRFTYDRATLVVVGPQDGLEIAKRIEGLFAGFPKRPRRALRQAKIPRQGGALREVAIEGADGSTFAWPIPPTPQARVWAKIWCRALDRQVRSDDEPTRARVRCQFEDDPRRGFMVVRVGGTDDPAGLLRRRIGRITSGESKKTVARQRMLILEQLVHALRLPLPMARSLAKSPPALAAAPEGLRPIADLCGYATVAAAAIAKDPSLPPVVSPDTGVRFVAPPQDP